MVSYSIVVVTWQCADQLRELVGSLNRHLDPGTELIVVDNASSDDPSTAAALREGETQFLSMKRNLGFGAAANAGVEAAAHDGVVVLNPDTVLLDSSLNALVEFALARRALAGPRLVNPDGSPQPSASGPPLGAWPWIGALLPGRLTPGPVVARTEPWRRHTTTRVAWLTGACLAAPVDILRSLGPFDPEIHMYGEDMDLGLRAAEAGIDSLFCPRLCRLMHRGGVSSAVLYPDGGEGSAAVSRRAVLRRVAGPGRERRAWLAQRLNLRLRLVAKGVLGRERRRERAALAAARVAHVDGAEARER